MKTVISTSAVIILFCSAICGQTIEYVTETLFTGDLKSVAVIDNYLYVSCGQSLQIFSLEEPEEPALFKNIKTGFGGNLMAVDSFLYSSGSAFIISDISDLFNPEIINHYTYGYYYYVADYIVDGNLAYVGVGSEYDYSHLVIIDISDPTSMVVISELDFGQYINDIEQKDSLIFITENFLDYAGQFHIVNISDPNNPQVISSSQMPVANAITHHGNYVYGVDSQGLGVINISNPENPQIQFYSSSFAGDGIDLIDNYLAIFGDGVYLLDISNPVRPQYVDGIETDNYIQAIAPMGCHIYTGAHAVYLRESTLYTFDFSDPYNLLLIDRYQYPGYVYDVSVENDHAFVACGRSSFYVIDITDPYQPILGNQYIYGSEYLGGEIQTSDELAYLSTGRLIKIFDISDPDSCIEKASINPGYYHRGYFPQDSMLYVVVRNYGLKIFNLANLNSPYMTDSLGGYENCLKGSFLNNGLFFLNNSYDLRIIDVGDPYNIFELSFHDCPGRINTIYTINDVAYISTHYDTNCIEIVDISNPGNPFTIDTVFTTAMVHDIVAEDNIALFCGYENIDLYDISTPSSPVFICSYALENRSYGFHVENDYIFIAQYYNLHIARLTPTGIEYINDIPYGFSLSHNYPNPFNARTQITYSLPYPGRVNLAVYDILGRKVQTIYNGNQPAGKHSVIWQADEFASGIYFYRLTAGDQEYSRQMTLLK